MEVLSKIAIAFNQGGMWMWAILGFQIVSIAIIIERVFQLYVRRKLDQIDFAKGFEGKIRTGQLEEVVQDAQRYRDKFALARAVEAGAQAALNFGGQSEIQGKMDEVLIAENANFEWRTGFLAMLGNVGTLTGLLGTIVGMIKSFSAVTYANPAEKATLLSNGISEAMNTTAYGLIMAIPALIMYAVLQSRASALAEDLNQGALRVYNWLSYSFEAVKPRK
jgi:biopolymer transport protein ExbB/TolQ